MKTIPALLMACTAPLLLVLAAFWSPLVAAESRPNVVMILTDDQRHDAAGFTGNTAIHTPNLDRLAKAGLIFKNCFVNTAICSVNRANLMAGQYPSRHGIDDFFKTFTADQLNQTVPARLRAAGYQTAFFGKWGIGDGPVPTAKGGAIFDYWAGQPMQTCFFHEAGCKYDLLNEPQRGIDPDEERCCRELLLPTLRRLADAMHAISPRKWALYQPLYRETGAGDGPFLPMRESFDRDRIIFAPHLYTMDLAMMNKTLDRYSREAALSQAPLLLGEWGPATDIAADTDPAKQARYTKVYEATANELDQRGIGAIKAWFCGTRTPLKSKKRGEPFTWAIFSDTNAVGHVERKYITDALARPRPLAVAGHIERYGFDFATRTLEVSLQPDTKLGSTEVFVSAERFYPDGFRVEVGPGLTLVLKPGATQLSPLNSADETNREQALHVLWNADSQHLVIEKWIIAAPRLTLKISPLPKRP